MASSDAAKKLRELIQGDDEAWAEVLRKLRLPEREPDDEEREAFWADLRRVVALIDSNPTSGRAELVELRNHAWRFGSCERVQVLRRCNRHRARKKLHRTQEAFFDPLHMPDEFVAATGDLLLVYFPDRKAMREVLEKAKRVGKGFITDPEQWRRLCELEKLVGAGAWTPHHDLERAVRRLRESTAGVPGIFPSLIGTREADHLHELAKARAAAG